MRFGGHITSTLEFPEHMSIVIFTSGCNLRCPYCHNPELIDRDGGEDIPLDELYIKIQDSSDFIDAVVITGGEPLLQAKFIFELFSKLKEQHIHTCIDTSGMVALTEDIKKVLSVTDLVLLDIKHIDDEKCKNLVGKSNKLELEFAKYLSDNNIKMWIRQVLVPGYTDDKDDLLKLKNFISTLKTVQKVELLPYHNLGRYKWEKLGITYPLEGVSPASDEDVEKAKNILGI